jgi:glycosyltransferase involved in cell wall biosynthesis
MLEALRADPCRFLEAMLDLKQLRRLWRAWRQRGTGAILDEVSSSLVDLESFSTPRHTQQGMESKSVVLVIDSRIPQYDRDAGSRSSFLYLKILCEMGHPVYFMPNDQLRREPYASDLEEMGVNLLIGRNFRCGRWKKWLKDHAGKISHVILHRPNVAIRYLPTLSKIRDIQILYFACDLRFLREMRHYEVDGDAFHLQEAKYWEGVEKGIFAQVDKAYFYSDEETRLVSLWGKRDIARTVPLFPVDSLPPFGLPYAQRSGLLFVGGFAHQPNVDGVVWFAKEVFPLVRQALPDIEWRIVGREPPPEVLGLMGSGVIIEGGVSYIRLETLYQSSRLVVAPLRFGAGIKGKVVEAVLQRVPLVTTAIGAEGMPEPETVLEIKDLPHDFATAVIKLYSDGNIWSAQSARMETYVVEHFSAATASKMLSEDIPQCRGTT